MEMEPAWLYPPIEQENKTSLILVSHQKKKIEPAWS